MKFFLPLSQESGKKIISLARSSGTRCILHEDTIGNMVEKEVVVKRVGAFEWREEAEREKERKFERVRLTL